MGLFLKRGNWWIDYYADGRRVRRMIGPNKTLALNVLRKRKVEVAEKRFLNVKKEQKIRFDEFADYYLELHSKVNDKAWKKFDRYNIKLLKEYFGGKYLCEITPEMIERFKTERIKTVTPATLNRNLACLKSIFNKAIEWGKVEHNPMKKVKLLKENNRRLRYLEKEEIARLLANCSSL